MKTEKTYLCPVCKEMDLIGCPVNAPITCYYCAWCNKSFKVDEIECSQNVKKEKDLPLGNSLEARSKAGEDYKQRNMPVKADNQHSAKSQSNKLYLKGYQDSTDKVLHLIDSLLRSLGRSNLVSKDELVQLRNNVVDLQEEVDKK